MKLHGNPIGSEHEILQKSTIHKGLELIPTLYKRDHQQIKNYNNEET